MLVCQCLHCGWQGSVFNEAEYKLNEISCPRCAKSGFIIPFDEDFLKPKTELSFIWLQLADIILKQFNKEIDCEDK